MRKVLYALTVSLLIAAGIYAQTTVAPNYPTGPVWDDLVSVAGAINPIGAAGQMTVDSDETAFIGCLIADAANETAVVQFQLSHGTADDTSIKPHIHWLVTGADVTGSAVFEANFRHCPLSGTCSAWSGWSDGTVAIEPADSEAATGLTAWTLADATYNFGISDIIVMQFRLKSLTVTATRICSVDVHFQKSANGSRQETVR